MFCAKFANSLISSRKSWRSLREDKLLGDNFRYIKKKRIFTSWYTKTGF